VARESDKPAKHRPHRHATRPEPSLDEALRKLGEAILNEPVPEILYRTLDATPSESPAEPGDHELNAPLAMDHRSFRDQLAFAIGFEITRHPDLLRRILEEHVSDGASQSLAKKVIEHLELSGFTIDEAAQVMTKLGGHHRNG
jgi:hypothetical protein